MYKLQSCKLVCTRPRSSLQLCKLVCTRPRSSPSPMCYPSLSPPPVLAVHLAPNLLPELLRSMLAHGQRAAQVPAGGRGERGGGTRAGWRVGRAGTSQHTGARDKHAAAPPRLPRQLASPSNRLPSHLVASLRCCSSHCRVTFRWRTTSLPSTDSSTACRGQQSVVGMAAGCGACWRGGKW